MAIVIMVAAFFVCAFLALIAEQLRRGAELALMNRADALLARVKSETDAQEIQRLAQQSSECLKRVVDNQAGLHREYREHIQLCEEWHRRILSEHGIQPERVN